MTDCILRRSASQHHNRYGDNGIRQNPAGNLAGAGFGQIRPNWQYAWTEIRWIRRNGSVTWCPCVRTDADEWKLSANETQLNAINVTNLRLDSEYELVVVAGNDVGTAASDQIRLLVGEPYAHFGIAPAHTGAYKTPRSPNFLLFHYYPYTFPLRYSSPVPTRSFAFLSKEACPLNLNICKPLRLCMCVSAQSRVVGGE